MFYEEALKIIISFSSLYLREMGFSALTFIKEKYRNSLGEEHPMRLALSDVESRFGKLLKRNGDKCCEIKVLLFCALFFCNYLVRPQLLLHIACLNEFGLQKKWLRNTALSH